MLHICGGRTVVSFRPKHVEGARVSAGTVVQSRQAPCPMPTPRILPSAALLTAVLSLAPVHAASPLAFNTTAPTNDLQGPLAAQVLFAQSQTIPARPREGDNQPHLISLRKSLLLVRPVKADATTPMTVSVRDGQGRSLGTLALNPPKLLPKTAYYVDGAPEGGIDFTPKTKDVGTVRGKVDVERLADPGAEFLLGLLRKHEVVEIETADGVWVRDIHLPQDKTLDGKIVRVKSQAGYGSTIHYSGRTATIARGQTLEFKCVNGQWFRDGDLENNAITYATDAWSAVLPAEWIAPGLTLQFKQGNLTGSLTGLVVGAPTQLLIHTIDVGMLTTPRGAFDFATDAEAHREYFQTVPTSRLIVTQYAPLSLPEVMMPSGALLTDLDESEGGWHTGNMRQSIGKELISHGIDNANYGLNSTSGDGEKSHPYVVAQLAAHNNRGKYSNGIQVHGGSGGGGIVTLDHSIGNELSHEVGHNYGLGHYVDGFKGSVHRPAGEINSTWGWDMDKGRFIPNFSPIRTGKDTCIEKDCQPPFDGRSFGLDAMAGGAPFSSFNRFTLYTPNSAAIIQRFLESKAVFDASSPTGFSKWNESTSRMEPYSHKVDVTGAGKDPKENAERGSERKPVAFGVPVVTLIGYYDPDGTARSYIYPALHGAYGYCYADDSRTLKAEDYQLVVETRSGVLRFRLASTRLGGRFMNKFHVNVPEASQPRSVAVVCRGKVLDKKPITPVTEKLTVTVNGLPPLRK